MIPSLGKEVLYSCTCITKSDVSKLQALLRLSFWTNALISMLLWQQVLNWFTSSWHFLHVHHSWSSPLFLSHRWIRRDQLDQHLTTRINTIVPILLLLVTRAPATTPGLLLGTTPHPPTGSSTRTSQYMPTENARIETVCSEHNKNVIVNNQIAIIYSFFNV